MKFTDPTGLFVHFNCSSVTTEECQLALTMLNNREGRMFNVTVNSNGLLKIDGDVDESTLSGGELELFQAITNENISTLFVAAESDYIHFGEFVTNGRNSIDLSDLKLLKAVSPKAAGEVIAHEIVEGSISINEGFELDYEFAHAEANKYFGNVKTTPFAECLPGACAKPFNI